MPLALEKPKGSIKSRLLATYLSGATTRIYCNKFNLKFSVGAVFGI